MSNIKNSQAVKTNHIRNKKNCFRFILLDDLKATLIHANIIL